MKWIVFIMTLIVLLQSLVPCMDKVCDNQSDTSIAISIPTDHQHTESDFCSPFCTCNCCAGFVFLNQHPLVSGQLPIDAAKNCVHLPIKISEISLPIWQPPQLS